MRNLLLVSAALIFSACTAEQQSIQSPNPFGPATSEYAKIVETEFAAKDWVGKTLPELSDALSSGDVTSSSLTRSYLDRIETIDRSGPHLQSVLSINPDAIAQAEASDARRKNDEVLGPLDGVPILFKDNIETLDPIATTAGSYALKDNITGRDSPLVAGLRAQGAVILGKTNLSQWANFRSGKPMALLFVRRM